MSNRGLFVNVNRVHLTLLVTAGWLVVVLCWMAYAWSRYSVFQNLTGVGIAALLYVAIIGAMWVADLGLRLAATVLSTLGWLSFALYWMAFARSWFTLLQNGAILMLSLLACGAVVVALWLGQSADRYC